MRQSQFPEAINVKMETDVADPQQDVADPQQQQQQPKRPDRAQRKMDNKGTRFRSIRMRLKTVCPSPLMQDAINHATVQLSRGTVHEHGAPAETV
jgi:hypothetical protein